MSNLLFSINIVLPIFIIIGIGIILRKSGVINATVLESLSTIVFKVALPAKLFLDTYTSDFTKIFNINFVLFAVIATTASFLLLLIILQFFVKDYKKLAAMVHGGYRANYVFLGLPLTQNILGKSMVPCTSLIIIFVVPLYNVLAVILLSFCNHV